MKKIKLLAIGASAAFAFTAVTSQIAVAAEEEAAATSKMTIPDTADGILQEIHKHRGELTETVKAKKLKDVHVQAFMIRDLANALPAKVAADKKARVEGSAKNITKLAEDLDTSGDAGDQAKTESNLKKFDAVLAQLEGQFK
ncbi:MAG: hypothetical protein H0W66_10780 [Chthoniobacterales bacterium]|nr:hypothetical protein [Chthoniobacterales bacterium]